MIRWGFIGCGDVVENKSGTGFIHADNSCIYAVMRRDLGEARASAQRLGAKAFYNQTEALINDPNVDAVYIATPPGLHYEQAMQCLEAGKPVYVEKAMTRNYPEALTLVEGFEQRGTKLFVAHYRRAQPRFVHLKQIIEEGIIGVPYAVDYYLNRPYRKNSKQNWLYQPELSGGGRFHDIAPHSIDILVFLFGKFVRLNSIATNHCDDYVTEDSVAFSFQTEQGVIGTANYCLNAGCREDSLTVYGTAGSLTVSMHDNEMITLKAAGQSKEISIPTPGCKQQPMIQSVVNELLGTGHCPCSGREALETVRIMDLAVEDYYGSRSDMFWKRPESFGAVTPADE